MVFKERLKEKRAEANLTQVELAEKAGVTARTIQNYELGNRKPSNMTTVQKIADALNTTTEYLNYFSSYTLYESKKNPLILHT